MSKSLSPEAVEALRRLNDVGVGQQPPLVSMSIAALSPFAVSTVPGAMRFASTMNARL